jgi:RNA polymerase sigma factor (sigma-70 family)
VILVSALFDYPDWVIADSPPRPGISRHSNESFREFVEGNCDKPWWGPRSNPLEWIVAAARGISFGFRPPGRLSTEDLRDISVETLLEFWEKHEEIEFPKAWCRTVLKHKIRHLAWESMRKVELNDSILSIPVKDAGLDEVSIEFRALLENAVSRLSPSEARVARLVLLEDCPIDEAASYLGIRQNTVRVYLGRACKRLLKDVVDDVFKEIGALPSHLEEPIRLYLGEKLSVADIAERLRRDEGKVRSEIRDAIALLRTRLDGLSQAWPRMRLSEAR